MKAFEKGQRVWWDDPICEKYGEYEVLDPQDELNAGKPEQERTILIGNGEDTWDSPAGYLTIVFPISFVDREQLGMQEYRNRIRDKELTKHIQELVAQFEGQTFEVEGNSVRISDEEHDACCVYGFCMEESVLYARLEYDDGRLRTVPVSNLCAVELFDAFCLLVKNA